MPCFSLGLEQSIFLACILTKISLITWTLGKGAYSDWPGEYI